MIQNNVIYRDDKEYPRLLKKIGREAPKQLYFKIRSSHPDFFERFKSENSHSEISERFTLKGSDAPQKFQNASFQKDLENLFSSPCLAVVGSRKLTSYGQQAGEQLIGQIAAAGITIVSGFMCGGDALAHQAAIKAGGRTIAVMPCGIDLVHPADQEKLYQEILDHQGLIISEYQGKMQPALWTYPRRNRIVAGLSQALLVLEAGEKSGSLITANYAKKFKRKIFALPGPITSSVSNGTNMLIKQGAEMVTSAQDVLEYFRSLTQRRRPQNDALAPCLAGRQAQGTSLLRTSLLASNEFGKKVLEMLGREPMSIDELSRDLGLTSSDLGIKLSLMEMRGMIRQRGNKYYIK